MCGKEEVVATTTTNTTNVNHKGSDNTNSTNQSQQVRQLPDYDQLSFDTGCSNNYSPIHTPLPEDSGRITRMSLSLLYDAIVFTVLSRGTFNKDSQALPSEDEQLIAKAICTYFSMYYSDERTRRPWLGWIFLMIDVNRYGIGEARRRHASKTLDGAIRKLTRNQIIKKRLEVYQKAADVREYLPLFEKIFTGFSEHLRSNAGSSAVFARDFEELQYSIYDQKRTYQYAGIVHDNGERHAISPFDSPQIYWKED